ncbi:hypothetical protein ACE6H2_012521 [Prunus campanulata]
MLLLEFSCVFHHLLVTSYVLLAKHMEVKLGSSPSASSWTTWMAYIRQHVRPWQYATSDSNRAKAQVWSCELAKTWYEKHNGNSSAKAATQFFKNDDLSFADCTINEASRVHDYQREPLALAPHGSCVERQ